MSFWSAPRTLSSVKNGAIKVRSYFGNTEVFVDGYDQSSHYIARMWRKAMRRAALTDVSSVLVLGLGIGSSLPEIRRRWPECSITVIDWDPVMISLFRQLYPNNPAEIIEGDVSVIIPRLKQKFDLVLVDLYTGKHPAPILFEDGMVKAIATILAPQGVCIVNAFAETGLLDIFAKQLKRTVDWKFRYNRGAIYVH